MLQRCHQAQLLPHTRGVVADALTQRLFIKVERRQQVVAQYGRPGVQTGQGVEHAPAGHPADQSQITRHITGIGERGHAIGGQVVPVDGHAAGGGGEDSKRKPDEGGLARAVGAKKPDPLAVRDLEVDVLERHYVRPV